MGNFELSIMDYTNAIEIDPNYAVAYNDRGYAYRRLGKFDDAIADYNKAIELDCKGSCSLSNRAAALEGKININIYIIYLYNLLI